MINSMGLKKSMFLRHARQDDEKQVQRRRSERNDPAPAPLTTRKLYRIELFRVDIADDVDKVQVRVLPQADQIPGVLVAVEHGIISCELNLPAINCI